MTRAGKSVSDCRGTVYIMSEDIRVSGAAFSVRILLYFALMVETKGAQYGPDRSCG